MINNMKEYGNRTHQLLITTSDSKDEKIQYSLSFNFLPKEEGRLKAVPKLEIVKEFSPNIINSKKKAKKNSLIILDMITASSADVEHLLKNINIKLPESSKIKSVDVGYYNSKKSWMFTNKAIFNDPSLVRIASNSRSLSGNPMIDLKQNDTQNQYSRIIRAMTSLDSTFYTYLKNTSNGEHNERIYSKIIELTAEIRRLNQHIQTKSGVVPQYAIIDRNVYLNSLKKQLTMYKSFRTVYSIYKSYLESIQMTSYPEERNFNAVNNVKEEKPEEQIKENVKNNINNQPETTKKEDVEAEVTIETTIKTKVKRKAKVYENQLSFFKEDEQWKKKK